MKDDLIEKAIDLKLAAPSVIKRWSTERLESEIENAGDSIVSESEIRTVRMYGNNKSIIDIPESKVQAHIDAGWSLTRG